MQEICHVEIKGNPEKKLTVREKSTLYVLKREINHHFKEMVGREKERLK